MIEGSDPASGKNWRFFKAFVFALLGLIVIGVLTAVLPRAKISSHPAQQSAIKIDVSPAPFKLQEYFADGVVHEGETYSLMELLPDNKAEIPGLLRDAGYRLKLGDPRRVYSLALNWGPVAEKKLEVRIFDAQDRLLAFWSEAQANVELPEIKGGVYRVVLNAPGLIGPAFKMTARLTQKTAPSASPPELQTVIPEAVPELNLTMDAASFRSWNHLRHQSLQSIFDYLQGKIREAKIPDIRFPSEMVADGHRSIVSLSFAGEGNPIHLSDDTPSFDVIVRAGPIMREMSEFKLTSFRTEQGLLDSVAQSIMSDEGVLMPRRMFVRVRFNNRNLGLYVAEEKHKSKGAFEMLRRYDGQLSSEGRIFANVAGGWPRKIPLTAEAERNPEIAKWLAPSQFAKTIALMSRFHAGHGLKSPDIRLYRPVLSERLEAWVKDVNIGTWPNPEVASEVMVHAHWWLFPPVHGYGPFATPKTFPAIPGIPDGRRGDENSTTTASLRFLPSAPFLNFFLSEPERREFFDLALMYASDPAMQRRFSIRLENTFRSVSPYLKFTPASQSPTHATTPQLTDAQRARLYYYAQETAQSGDDSNWVQQQVENYSRNELDIPRLVRLSACSATVFALVHPLVQSPGKVRVQIFNFSPFSLRVSGASIPTPHVLAPTPFFMSASSLRGADYLDDFLPNVRSNPATDCGPARLTASTVERLLSLESDRLASGPRERAGGRPYMEFVAWQSDENPLANLSMTIAGKEIESRNRIAYGPRDLGDQSLPVAAVIARTLNLSSLSAAEKDRHPQIAFGKGGEYAVFNGVDTAVEVSRLPANASGLVAGLWIRPRNLQGVVSLLDTHHDAHSNCGAQISPLSNQDVQLHWGCAGSAISVAIPIEKWTHLTLIAENKARQISVWVNGIQISQRKLDASPISRDAPVTLGRLGSSRTRYYKGDIAHAFIVAAAPAKEQIDALSRAVRGILSDPPGAPDPATNLPKNSPNGPEAINLSALLNNAARSGNTPPTPFGIAVETGPYGKQLKFQGTTRGLKPDIDPAKWPGLTLGMWIRIPVEQPDDAMVVMDFDHSVNDNCALTFVRETPSHPKGAFSWLCGGRSITWSAPAGQWHKIMVGVDQQSRELWASINSEPVFRTQAARVPFGASAPFTLGSQDAGQKPFKGEIAALTMWRRSLKADELARIKTAGFLKDVDVSIIPLGVVPDTAGIKANYLISNLSRREVEVDLDKLVWRDESGEPVKFRLGATNVVPAKNRVLRLAPTDFANEPNIRLPSAWFWPGAAMAPILGGVGKAPNAVIVEVYFSQASLVWTDASGVARFPQENSPEAPLTVVVEPQLFHLTKAMPLAFFAGAESTAKVKRKSQGADGERFAEIELPSTKQRIWHIAVRENETGSIPNLAVTTRSKERQLSTWRAVTIDEPSRLIEAPGWWMFKINGSSATGPLRIVAPRGAEMRVLPDEYFSAMPVSVTSAKLAQHFTVKKEEGKVVAIPKQKELTFDHPILVPAGVRLLLPEGTILRFGPMAGLLSYGEVFASGAVGNPVAMVPIDPAAGWIGFAAYGEQAYTQLNQFRSEGTRAGFMGGHQFSGGFSFYHSKVEMNNVRFSKLKSHDGLHFSHTEYKVRGLALDWSIDDAIDIDWGHGFLEDLDMANCGAGGTGDCLDLSATLATIRNLKISGATDKGVSIGERSVLTMSGITIAGARNGIAVKDGSRANIKDCRVDAEQYGLARYIKKPYHGYPDYRVINCQFHGNLGERFEGSSKTWTSEFN